MKKITNLEIGALVFFLMHANFIGITFNSLINISKQDSYLSILIGFIVGIIPLIIYIYIFNYEPNLNLNEKNVKLFGNIFGNIINIIILIFTLLLITIAFSNLITIIHSDYLSKTPIILVIITFLIPIYYAVNTGLKSICRTSLIMLYITILLIILSNIGLLIQIDINNFKPFIHNTKSIFNGSIYFIMYNITPLYLINIIPKNSIMHNNKTVKYILFFYFMSILSLFLVNLNIIGILGYKLSILFKYPEFQILKKVSILGISSRIDSILFIQWIFEILIFVIIGLYHIINTSKSFITEKNNIFLTIYCIIILSLTLIVPNDLFLNLLSIKILPYIIIIFTITIFILMFIKINYTSKIKCTNNTSNK
ncbi:MAG: GerAB/ArcD/ProY family transporter [Bacilli bacterium]|nr:GerAB/ArcD/ProY family transporter [Bacilli bacterium]